MLQTKTLQYKLINNFFFLKFTKSHIILYFYFLRHLYRLFFCNVNAYLNVISFNDQMKTIKLKEMSTIRGKNSLKFWREIPLKKYIYSLLHKLQNTIIRWIFENFFQNRRVFTNPKNVMIFYVDSVYIKSATY